MLRGEWRPADVHIGKLATHEIEETFEPPKRPDPVADSRRASNAAKVRSTRDDTEERRAGAERASDARWRKEVQP